MKYGWHRDRPDIHDNWHRYKVDPPETLPKSVDLRAGCPPVYDQGNLGSCTANALAAAVEFDLRKQGLVDFMPSRLFIYYGERTIEHTIGFDAGAQLRDGIKVVHAKGVPPEGAWPYDDSDPGPFTTKPPASVFAAATAHRVASYARVPQAAISIKTCLASGYPVAFGFTVYESFEGDDVAQTGAMPMPKTGEQILGGHAVLCVGYDDAARTFLVRNSWGLLWGKAGYFTMPFDYMLSPDLASDFWTVRAIAG